MMCPNWKTKQGFDMQFGVNHLGIISYEITTMIFIYFIKS